MKKTSDSEEREIKGRQNFSLAVGVIGFVPGLALMMVFSPRLTNQRNEWVLLLAFIVSYSMVVYFSAALEEKIKNSRSPSLKDPNLEGDDSTEDAPE